jgi:O-succinylbenzoic acid--CoA ligase
MGEGSVDVELSCSMAGAADTELAGSEVLPDFLEVAARAHPSKIALSYGEEQWTFSELERAVAKASGFLLEATKDFGKRVGILAANRPGYVFAVHAAARAGVVLTPLNWRQAADELAWQIEDAQIGVLLVDREHLPIGRAACSGLPVQVLSIEALEQPPGFDGAVGPAPPIDLGREAAIIYTSGTSGRPKGARITYGNLWFSAVASSLHIGHDPNDVWLAVLPLFHIGGLSILFRGVIGATRVELYERFEPDRVREAFAGGVTLASLVPTMLERIVGQCTEAPWASQLRCVLIGGGPAPSELIARCAKLGIPVSPTYGLTESASQVSTLRPEDVLRKLGSSGQPLPTTEVRIVDGGSLAQPSQIGGIEVRGPTIFAGYLGDQKRELACEDGWFATGDDGYLDEEGYLYVVDRREDLIVSGGENIYPTEVERVLSQHPSVADAGVVGVPSVDWGARPVAAVVWRGQDGNHAEETLLAHCREKLAEYKVPDRVVVTSVLPRSPSGKLLRRELRETLTRGMARSRGFGRRPARL